MIETGMRSGLFKVGVALADAARVGAMEIARAATPEELRLPSKKQHEYKPFEIIPESYNQQNQTAVDAQRLAEIRASLRSFGPQGESKRRDRAPVEVVRQPLTRPVPLVRNRG